MSTKTDILLEAGTNELEVLEFTVAGNSFGINVAKVSDLLRYDKIQLMPRAHPCVEGIFQPRERVYTVIDLAGYLGLGPSADPAHDILIIASFNQIEVAFHVHSVESIHRISWSAIEKPSETIYGGNDGIVTGIARVRADKTVLIIDFEKIIFDIAPRTGLKMDEIEKLGARVPSETPLLIAEDSVLLRRMLSDALTKAGYTNLTICDNGQEAWDAILRYKSTGMPVASQLGAVITDIEMPQMDGLHLTKLIRTDPYTALVPVIVFSSLIDEAMQLKCIQVGATAQLSKPEIGNLVSLIDKAVNNRM